MDHIEEMGELNGEVHIGGIHTIIFLGIMFGDKEKRELIKENFEFRERDIM